MTVRHDRRSDKTPLCGASYGKLRLPHTPKEDTDVLPPPCDRMDHGHPDPLAPLDHTASDRLGPVEPGDGAGPLLRIDGRQRVPGDMAGPQRASRTPAVARVLLRGHRQTRDDAPRARRGALLCPPTGLGRKLVAAPATGTGPRCDHLR